MIEVSLALQTGVRARLLASPPVLDLVAANRIVDGRKRPELFPCVILGEAMTTLEAVTYSRQHVRAYLDLHCWTNEDGLADVKALACAVQVALKAKPDISPHALIDGFVSSTRFMRDPSGEHGHAVLTYEALIEVRT